MSILLSKYGNEMTTKPKGMNAATWACFQRARVMMKSEGIDFETAYDRCRQGNRISAGNDFLAEVERTMTDKKVGRGATTRVVVAEQPHLHEIWLESQNKIKREK